MNVRKRFFVIGMIIMALIFIVPSYAAETYHTYRLDQWKMQLDIPANMAVITPTSVSDEAFFAEIGVDVPALQNAFISDHVYLNAVAADLSDEIMVIVFQDDVTQHIWNHKSDFDKLTYEELSNQFTDACVQMEGQINEEGFEGGFVGVHDTDTAKYITFQMTRSQNGVPSFGRQYYTLVNGSGITITFWSYRGAHTSEQIEQQIAILDSVAFDQILDNPNPTEPENGSLTTALIMIANCIVIYLFTAINQKKKTRNNLDPCLVKEPSTFGGNTFTYRGKVYDRDKFVSNASFRFNLIKRNRDKTLEKLLKTARRKASSAKPDAIISELEAEALAGLLFHTCADN